MKSLRILSFSVLICIGYLTPLPVFIVGAIMYVLIWHGYEVLILAALIDAQFGVVPSIFMFTYTVSAMCIILVAHYIKPYLRFYDELP